MQTFKREEDTMKYKISIGQVSKMYGISLDTLRHYDRIGILKPIIEPSNGYRYYSLEHLDLLESILVGKYLETPLKDMKFIVQEESIHKYVELIEKQENAIQEKIKHLQQLEEYTGQLKKLLYEIMAFKNDYDFEQMIAEDVELQLYVMKLPDFLKRYVEIKDKVRDYDVEHYVMFYRNREGDIIEYDEYAIFSILPEYKLKSEENKVLNLESRQYAGTYMKARFYGTKEEMKTYLKQLVSFFHIDCSTPEILVKYEFCLLHRDLNHEYFAEILLPV
ncbi:MerR family DNA-binding transcriptional regulator [Paenibacillus dendritiformis]|uniref:MerR family DNA-binding transcriptional regulator n=1 Tax=Paenibacillus dendritiformis TaxID=130049 RepID=UPI00143DB838|nr:MerR family DNA-binding transcriptional regulator [Paenibacillus dendritiformis]NKI22315.1 MerR family DNA-binding transcriptional regulator [Paenibacillus dendritiformis]NRF99519.1 MerR family DNA-binding transcriptional regulator [Paenibacillus dendritiformis]